MSINSVNHEQKSTHPDSNPSIELEIAMFIVKLKNGVWLVGIPSWIFGITDRSIAAFADGYLSVVEVTQLFMTAFFFVSWLYLKPERSSDINESNSSLYQGYLCRPQSSKFKLKKRHMISQEYILPFPYLCQIYHLLNLKHLETIHRFSLNNLKIVDISYFQPTAIGGIIKFQTILDSPVNPLRIWRQAIVEVDLILHTPYTVELSIPVYNNKRIIVFFQTLPLNDKEHHLFIDIYSDLEWPKPLLQILLHFASCLTLFEDLPYLQALTDKKVERLFNLKLASKHDNMLLFKRFVELYCVSQENTKLITGSNYTNS
jgi:hypothetical protein